MPFSLRCVQYMVTSILQHEQYKKWLMVEVFLWGMTWLDVISTIDARSQQSILSYSDMKFHELMCV